MKAKNTKTPPKANRARRPRTPKKLHYTVRGSTEPLTEAEERAQEEHVKKLIKEGSVKPGKGGLIPELLRPGPRCKGDIQKALRWARGDDA